MKKIMTATVCATAAIVALSGAVVAPAQAATTLPSLKQLKVTGDWSPAPVELAGNSPEGLSPLCPLGKSCSVQFWFQPSGQAASYAEVSAGKAASKADALARVKQLQAADTTVSSQQGHFAWTKQKVKAVKGKKPPTVWTGKLMLSGVPFIQSTVVMSGTRVAAFYTYGLPVALQSKPKDAVAALSKLVLSKKQLPTLTETPRGFVGALNAAISSNG